MGVYCLEPTVERAIERDISGGHERATPARVRLFVLPDLAAAHGIPGDESAEVSSRTRMVREINAYIWSGPQVRGMRGAVIHAEVVARRVKEMGARRVSRRGRGTHGTFETRAHAR